jgi:plasmid stabilization system protein ParE
MFEVVLSKTAVTELEDARRWWTDNRSEDQANTWYNGFVKRMELLRKDPERFGFAPEIQKLHVPIRQLAYGLGRHPTHRAIYIVRANRVTILRVRHLAQDEITEID